jgi:hypothetical protein
VKALDLFCFLEVFNYCFLGCRKRDQAQNLWDLLLGKNICESKEKEFNISDTSELGSKCFYLSVEGLCRGAGASVIKVVDDVLVMGGHCFSDSIEGLKPRLTDRFLPVC